MNEKFKKGLSGLVTSSVFVSIFYLLENRIIYDLKTYILVSIGVVASIYQPAYNPFKKAQNKVKDAGTTAQVIWSVYLSLAMALVESICFRYPESMNWSWYTYISLSISLLGLFLRSWSYIELGNFFTWNLHVTKKQRVISTGPYRFVAHPSYTGAFLTYSFNCLFFHAWISFFFSVFLLSLCFYRRIKYEEELLIEEMGEEYDFFCNSRAKLIPLLF